MQASTLGNWFTGLLQRHDQLGKWLTLGRPRAYWLTGFFNPQGFLTAMKQEVNGKHASDKWALDDVVMTSEVTHPPKVRTVWSEALLCGYRSQPVKAKRTAQFRAGCKRLCASQLCVDAGKGSLCNQPVLSYSCWIAYVSHTDSCCRLAVLVLLAAACRSLRT